jgi:cytoskeletal protein CcmA (bactofilin family)
MTILVDGLATDGFSREARIKIWLKGVLLGEVEGLNFLNPLSCDLNTIEARVELEFPEPEAHGASHLAEGADPIPEGELLVTGVRGKFQVGKQLGIGTSPIAERAINIKTEGEARIYLENDSSAALDLELRSSSASCSNMLIFRGENTEFFHFQDTKGFRFSTRGEEDEVDICLLDPGMTRFITPLSLEADLFLQGNTLYLDPFREASISYDASLARIIISTSMEILDSVFVSDELEVGGSLTVRGPGVFDSELVVAGTGEFKGNVLVQKNLYVKGKEHLFGELKAEGEGTFKSDVSIRGDLSVRGFGNLRGGLEVEGATQFKDDVSVQGSLSVEGRGNFLGVPAMREAQRPELPKGVYGIIFNLSTEKFEGWNGTEWVALS